MPVCDLAAVTRDRVAFWSAFAEEQRRQWAAHIADVPLAVGLPREELEAVVDALLDNVFTHTPAGTSFEVIVAAVGPEHARLVVHDHGPGFHASSPETPFGLAVGRTGLGLDIATRAVHAAGGTLEMDDDDGAVVRVELPLVPADAAVPPADRRRHLVTHRWSD